MIIIINATVYGAMKSVIGHSIAYAVHVSWRLLFVATCSCWLLQFCFALYWISAYYRCLISHRFVSTEYRRVTTPVWTRPTLN